MEDLKKLAKECLSIISTATVKDNEITMWINAAISDLKRLGIDADTFLSDELVRSAVILYVKGHFGNVDIREKQLCLDSYNLQKQELALSAKYRIREVDSNV
jgi:hypothetical protein